MTEPKMMYYVLRKGNQFKIGHLTAEGARYQTEQEKWELYDRPSNSREEAVKAMEGWKARHEKLSGL